ncbi:HIT family protein 1 [Podospora conica]|nr:HIT family protein 1 [Schizothecium conicum]
MSSRMASCIFCKIVKGEIPSLKLYESEKTLAFLDIQPLSRGHALIIPKYHGKKLADIPDEYLTELLPVAKKLAIATGTEEYNILQNNGKGAHQEIDHVHVHMIPKPSPEKGLGIRWPTQATEMDKLKELRDELAAKM